MSHTTAHSVVVPSRLSKRVAGAIVSSVDMLPAPERPEGRGFEVLPTR